MMTLFIATRNIHKVQEIRVILGGAYACRTLADFPEAPELLEDADTFAGNATKKAVQLAKWLAATMPREGEGGCEYVLADDSGLEVDFLNGAPGVHSARFASLDTGSPENSSAEKNNQKLLRLLQNVPMEERTGRFCCVLALTPALKVA